MALSLLLVVTAACGFPRPPDVGDDAAPAGCSRDQDCSSLTPFCVDTACVACRDSTSCPASRPVCDMVSHDCRTCAKDNECDSGACDLAAGKCVDQGAILYASPSGGITDPCTQTSPCSLQRAAELVGTGTSYIVLQPGRYSGGADFNGKQATVAGNNSVLYMVDDPTSLININNGSIINIRNVDLEENLANLNPETPAAIEVSMSDLTIDDMQSTTTNVDAVAFTGVDGSTDGTLTVRHSKFTNKAISGARLIIDACLFQTSRSSSNLIFLISTGGSIQMTNSIAIADPASETLAINSIGLPDDSKPLRSNIAHNTFVGGAGIACNQTATSLRMFDSNIFYNVPAISAPIGCQYQYNLSAPNAGLPGTGNITGDPMFKDAPYDDFHLKPGSAAIDAANPTDALTGHDFDGTPRPKGARSDIGAFEYVPAR